MPDAAHRASAGGEQGETLSILKRLAETYDVTYYGAAQGTFPAGVRHVNPLDEWPERRAVCKQHGAYVQEEITAEQQGDMFRHGERALGEVDAFVHVLGMEGSSCYVGNAFGSKIQAADLWYCSSAMHAVHTMNRPRICINNDPRSYPKLQETTTLWPECLPWALLDQTSESIQRVIGRVKVQQKSVYAASENWWTYGRERPDIDWSAKDRNVVVSHAHIADGCKQKRRHEAWERIFSNRDGTPWSTEEFKTNRVEVYGKGWEAFENDAEDTFRGFVRPSEVQDLLIKSRAQPCVAPKHAFYTGKASVSSWYGCAPLFYGRGDEYTYDVKERYLPLEHSMRVHGPGDLEHIFSYRDEVIEDYNELIVDFCRPRWELFDDCVADAVASKPKNVERYGGIWLQ
jgi:hypothetical protein